MPFVSKPIFYLALIFRAEVQDSGPLLQGPIHEKYSSQVFSTKDRGGRSNFV